MANCGACDGKGSVKCPQCSGTGRKPKVFGGSYQCDNCDGSGVVKCGACHGRGRN